MTVFEISKPDVVLVELTDCVKVSACDVAFDGTADIRPKPVAATATSATRLRVVFVDIDCGDVIIVPRTGAGHLDLVNGALESIGPKPESQHSDVRRSLHDGGVLIQGSVVVPPGGDVLVVCVDYRRLSNDWRRCGIDDKIIARDAKTRHQDEAGVGDREPEIGRQWRDGCRRDTNREKERPGRSRFDHQVQVGKGCQPIEEGRRGNDFINRWGPQITRLGFEDSIVVLIPDELDLSYIIVAQCSSQRSLRDLDL